MSHIIKTTARFQEAQEPVKQKPVIQMDNSLKPLPNTIRASIDTGRDNPFKPDGKIYKSADPIVDFYKYGPNQSRAQSPTDSQLLLESGQPIEAKKKNKKRSRRDKGELNEDKSAPEGARKRSCWRRWFCCCCPTCCDSSNKSTKQQKEESKNGQITIITHEIEPYNNERAVKDINSRQARILVISREPSPSKEKSRDDLNIEFVESDREVASIEDNKPGGNLSPAEPAAGSPSKKQRQKSSNCSIS